MAVRIAKLYKSEDLICKARHMQDKKLAIFSNEIHIHFIKIIFEHVKMLHIFRSKTVTERATSYEIDFIKIMFWTLDVWVLGLKYS